MKGTVVHSRKEIIMKKIRYSGVRKWLKGRGFAAALVLSISAVGVSAYVAYNSTVSKLSEIPDRDMDAAAVENPQHGVPRAYNDPETEAVREAAQTQAENAIEPVEPDELQDAEEANRFIRPESPKIMPVDGEVTNPFSNGELVKSNTLGVWRTHDAVDIAAALGGEVKAMQRGTVSEVFTNAMWGICVTIDHGDGVISSYMGLDNSVNVEAGSQVEAGDVIALIGNTAEAEIADPPHLHFAVKKNDVWVDPIAYIEERL